MFTYKLATFLRFVGALLVCVVLAFFVVLCNVSAFPNEEKTEYYLYSASSQAKIVKDVNLLDLLYVKGEKIETKETDVEFLLAKYKASVVFEEKFEDKVAYYCYSPNLKTPVRIDGKFINLQIVVKRDSAILASPLVFGGY